MFDFLSRTISSIFSGLSREKTLSEGTLGNTFLRMEEALLEADVPLEATRSFLAEARQKLTGASLEKGLKPEEQMLKAVYDSLVGFLGGSDEGQTEKLLAADRILVMGLQGAGKTTTIAKIARLIAKTHPKKSLLVASVDFARPAAREQLAVSADAAGVASYLSTATDPLAAVGEISSYARQNGYSVVLLDTAGRLHVNNEMLEELRAVEAAFGPQKKIIVLDGMTGQESLRIARAFEQAVGFDGALITKMDSGARGGALFAFRYALKKPVYFLGTGEKVDDIEPFRAERVASRMLGMGDIATLVERANEKIKESEQERLNKAIQSGDITLEDFAAQIDMLSRMGPLVSILKMLPGGLGAAMSEEQMQQGEVEVKRSRSIINSMTLAERRSPALLDQSRKERIARGAGVSLKEVNDLLVRFEQGKQMLQQMKKMGPLSRLFN
jgi:signal recognition particle subunit SRP54